MAVKWLFRDFAKWLFDSDLASHLTQPGVITVYVLHDTLYTL